MSNFIVVPLDGSAVANAAIPHAAELARRTQTGLHVITVHRPVNPVVSADSLVYLPDPQLDIELQEQARAWLMKRAAEIRVETGLPVTAEFRIGPVVEEICAAAAARDTRLIVCTTHGAGGWGLHWIGSIADGLIRNAPCPVLAMSEAAVKRPVTVKKMLILLDGSAVSAAILPPARWLAHAFGATVDLLRVASPPWFGETLLRPDSTIADRFDVDGYARMAKEALDEAAANLRSDGLTVTSMVNVDTDTVHAILERITLADPDIVALATHGRGISRLFVGSISDKVLRTSSRPTLCLRPQDVVETPERVPRYDSLFAGAAV